MFNAEAAKKSGYSDSEIEEFLVKKHSNYDVKAAKKAGYSSEEIINFLSKPQSVEKSETKQEQSESESLVDSIKDAAKSYGSGFGGGAGGIPGDIGNLLSKVPIPQGKLIGQLQQLSGIKGTEELSEQIQNEIGGKEPETAAQRILQKSGEFGGQGLAIGTGLGGPIGGLIEGVHSSITGAVYQGIKELGGGEEAALIGSMILTANPTVLRKIIPKVAPKFENFISKIKSGTPAKQAAKEVEFSLEDLGKIEGAGDKLINKFKKEAAEVPKSETETLTSGLTKPRSMEAEHTSKGLITNAQQTKAVERLNKEATELTSKAVEKHVPVSKMIEEGHDFAFNERFTNLQKIASEANPDINITSVSKFLSDSAKEYKGLPKNLLNDEAKKILSHVNTLKTQPQTEMKNLIRLFRINNKKIGDITAKRLVKGPQKEYEGFLKGLNKSIEQAFVDTLPTDSAWLKEFQNLNKEYSQVQKAKQVQKQLETVLDGTATANKLRRLANNAKDQRKLEHYMGKEGASEIIQIAKDLDSATQSIKKIPVKELSKYDAIFPLSLLVPGMQLPAAIPTALKAFEFGRRGYGHYLTTPQTRKSVNKALKAIESGNIQSYKKATDELKILQPIKSENLQNLQQQLSDVRYKKNEIMRKHLSLPDEISGKFNPVEQYEVSKQLESEIKKEMEILSKIRNIEK